LLIQDRKAVGDTELIEHSGEIRDSCDVGRIAGRENDVVDGQDLPPESLTAIEPPAPSTTLVTVAFDQRRTSRRARRGVSHGSSLSRPSAQKRCSIASR